MTVCYCLHSVRKQRRFSSVCTCKEGMKTVRGLMVASGTTRALAQDAFFNKAQFSVNGRLRRVQKRIDTSRVRQYMPYLHRLSLLIFGNDLKVRFEDLRNTIRTI